MDRCKDRPDSLTLILRSSSICFCGEENRVTSQIINIDKLQLLVGADSISAPSLEKDYKNNKIISGGDMARSLAN